MKVLRSIKLYTVFAVFYLRELAESNFLVTWDVLSPTPYYKPGIITVPVEVLTEYQAVLLANLITMTPGTIAVDYSSDNKNLYIHLMYTQQKDDIIKKMKAYYVPFVKELIP